MEHKDCPWCGETIEFDMWDRWVICAFCEAECDIVVGEVLLADGDEMLTVDLIKST